MTTPTNSDRLREIAERAEKATPGPWVNGQMPEWESWMIVSESAFDPGDDEDPTPIKRPIVDSEYTTPADAEFIASAREDIPFLLSEINKLQAEIERLQKSYLRQTQLNTEAINVTKELEKENTALLAEIKRLEAEKAETIEVLELYGHGDTVPFEDWEYPWWRSKAKPLLDKLKGE